MLEINELRTYKLGKNLTKIFLEGKEAVYRFGKSLKERIV